MIRSTSHNNNSSLESRDNSGVEQLFFPSASTDDRGKPYFAK